MEHLSGKWLEIGRLLGQAIIGSACVGYFMFHAVQGENGFGEMVHLQTRVLALETERATLETRRQAMEKRVHMLRAGSLDPDLLEERIRAVLQYSRPTDRVVILSDRSARSE